MDGKPARSAFIAVVLFTCDLCANGQSTFGALLRTVTDVQMAVIPGAEVLLTEVRTSVSRSMLTTNVGAYEFVNINQGQYRLQVVKNGLAPFATQNFEVAARQTVRIDAELRPADVRQAVTVRDFAPIINTENPTIASSTDNRELKQLPFTFRVFN